MIQEPQSFQLRQEDQQLIPRLPDPFPDEIDLPPVDDINNDPADRDEFDQTYLAKRGNWNIGGSVSSPAPYPLQVIPRVAYTINFNFTYNDSRDRWEPQKKSEPVGFSEPEDVSGDRSPGSWETNDTDGNLLVMVRLAIPAANMSGSDAGHVEVNGHINDTRSDNQVIRNRSFTNENAAGSGVSPEAGITMVVGPGLEYKVEKDRTGDFQTSDVVVGDWTEANAV